MAFRPLLPLFAALVLGCSDSSDDGGEPLPDTTVDDAGGGDDTFDATRVDSADATDTTITDAEADATLDADAAGESATDAADATDGGGDATLDGSSDGSDAGSDVVIDTAPDIAYDTAFTPPTWSPVCVPPPPPPRPDAGPDAADATDADDATDAVADATDGDDDTSDAATPSDVADAVDATDAADASPPDTAGCTATRLRIVASNLTSGGSPTYEAAGIHILQGLHPDIALMQEFKYTGSLRTMVDTTFDPTFRYFVGTGAIPNGIVSRYPIIVAGEWDDPDLTDREFVWARIDVPGPIDLFAVSTHIRTTSAPARDAEAKNLVAYIKANVPAGVYLVIGGDFNTAVTSEPALIDLAEVVDVFPPYAVDQAGISNTNAPRSKPYDWVMPGPSLFARMIPVSIGAASFPSGLVFDSRVYTPLSDVTPVLSTDSSATNMQHMAIVRDFALGD